MSSLGQPLPAGSGGGAERLRLILRLRRGRRRPSPLIAACYLLIAAVVLCAITGTLLAPHDPAALNPTLVGRPPGHGFLLGTDGLGRDIFSRIIAGARHALVGPLVVAAGSLLLSIGLGLVAGYRGGLFDSLTMRWVDVLFTIPGFLVVIVVVGVVGGGYWLAVLVLVGLHVPVPTRVIRGATLEQRSRPYIEAARAMGLSQRKIMFGHILPNLRPVLVANFFLGFTYAIVELASLSFLGLGAPPGSPDWGAMLSENRTLIYTNPWAALAPALMIVLVAASMNLIGDHLFEKLSDRGRAR